MPMIEFSDAQVRQMISLLELLIVHLNSAIETALMPDGTVQKIDRMNVETDLHDVKRARLILVSLKALRQRQARPKA